MKYEPHKSNMKCFGDDIQLISMFYTEFKTWVNNFLSDLNCLVNFWQAGFIV